MDLIDRYLAAVRRHLPRNLQDDVIQELTDNLRSEAEEREQEAGRALNADEQSALLKKHGHPWLMASRYLPQQQLIGPALFPYYRQTLILVLFWIVLPITLIGGALSAIYSDNPGQAWAQALGAAWNGAIYATGIVTLVFAVLERERVRFTALDKWDPSWLPTAATGRPVPRGESVAGLAFGLTFLLWWLGLIHVPQITSWGGQPVRFVAAAIWTTMYYPILISLLASIAIYLVDLVRPWRSITVSLIDLAIGVYNVIIVAMVLRAGHFVEVIGDPTHADVLTRAASFINASVEWTFIVLGAVFILDMLYEVWLMTHTSKSARVISSLA